MIRSSRLALMAGVVLFGFGAAPVMAQQSTQLKLAADDNAPTSAHQKAAKAKSGKSAKAKASKSAAKRAAHKSEASDDTGDSKPTQIASFGDWGAFLAQDGKEKTCYVLAQPQKRDPSKLKRDPAYVFISNRPRENIHNEVSVMMGFPMKDGGDAEADVAGTSFDLVSKGTNAWIKNPAQEAELIAAMKKSAKLVVKASSLKGHLTTDSYSLAGLSLALARAEKECR